ncbi:hypothetical protein EDD15DRAFT_2365234 [Pisolithus albus]|nr:hypothetical protein EDD15DRAFT_2365234 [Pisolithus albus]
MGLVQSHFAGMLAVPPKGDAREGSPISGSPAPTAQTSLSSQNFCTATLVELAQKHRFCEDQDSALGPPTKIPRGTSLVLKTSSVSVQQIPLTTPSLKRKSSKDQDLSLGPPAKVPRTSSLIPNELLGHITTFLPPNSLLALTQLPYLAFSTSLDDMDGGRLPCYKLSHQFRFHPYARVKPSAREIVMAALYDDTSDEELFVPSSAIADSNAPLYAGRLPHDKLSCQFRFHLYAERLIDGRPGICLRSPRVKEEGQFDPRGLEFAW